MSGTPSSRVTGTRDVHGTRVSFDIDATLVSALDDVFLRYPLATHDDGPTLMFIADRRTPELDAIPRTFFVGALHGSTTPGTFTLANEDVRVDLDLLSLPARHLHAVAKHASDDLRTGGLIALSLALRVDGLHHLHAAGAITAAGTRVLLVGGSGSGKTTTLLGLVAGGAKPTADDVVFLQRRADGARALGHPRAYHLTPEIFARFPDLAYARIDGVALPPKIGIDPRLVPDLANPTALETIDVIAFPRVAGERTEARDLPAAEAFTALLAQSAFIVLPGATKLRDQLDLLASLVKQSRCVELSLAEDALLRPALLTALIDHAARRR